MAINDLEAFVRQRAVLFDPNLDVNPGSPFDTQIIQPLLRRVGNDPFTTDLTTFINDRLVQAFPDLATKEGDALTDLLNKPASLLWDPIVREITRVRRNLSFNDPSTLTDQEADSLGANFFSERRKGEFARGPGRIFYKSPQNSSISPMNFFTSKGGLHFFPSEIQSIRTEEMILNLSSDGLYYFDVNTIAESPGSKYRIGTNELVSVANVPSAVRVQNLRRFGFGENEEGAQEFVDRVRQELSERSLVTLRGIAAKLLNNFPEVSRLNVVGFNDPEMQRDVVKGGGLGVIVASGSAGIALADGESGSFTRRFFTSEVNFQSLILGNDTSFAITVWDAFGPVVMAQDLDIRSVISANEINFEQQTMFLGAGSSIQSWQTAVTPLRWTLRKKTLTLSDIPGGILFPDSANGTVDIPDDEVHVGGAYDVHIRGSDFDEATLVLSNLTDDDPILSGTQLFTGAATNLITLDDLVLDSNYEVGDDTYSALDNAGRFGFTLQILTGVDAGNYQVQLATQVTSTSPVLTLDRNLTSPALSGNFKWRLVDELNIDLIEPKETRLEGSDLRTVQGSATVDTVGGTDFNDFGVSEDDVMRILSGPDAGDFSVIADPVSPFDKLILDTPLTQSQSDLDYIIFRPNPSGGLLLPLVRLREIELLDASSQPIGSTIPYAKPVDAQSRAFQNPARGIKHDLVDVRLGLVTIETASVFSIATGSTLDLLMDGTVRTVTFGAAAKSIAYVISEISTQIEALTSIPDIAVAVGSKRVGIRPSSVSTIYAVGGTSMVGLFGATEVQSTADVRSATVEAVTGGWDALDPSIDLSTGLDVIQPLDGVNTGFYGGPFQVDLDYTLSYPGLAISKGLQVGAGTDALGSPVDSFQQFSPEDGRRVQVGVRSIGSVRLFFLSPTSIEFDSDDAIFTLAQPTGDLRFIPDPSLTYQQVPSMPNGDQPADGSITGATSLFNSVSQNFVLSNILPGDKLVIDNHPIQGTAVLTDPMVAIAGSLQKTLVFSLDGGPDRTLTFIRDQVSLNEDECSKQGVVDQINAAAGDTICELTGSDTIKFTTERDLVIRSSGTANTAILDDVFDTGATQSFITDDQSNASPHQGTYDVLTINSGTQLSIVGPFPASSPFVTDPVVEQTYRIERQGVQRISTTEMSSNDAEAGLYYFDVELVSEGSGDVWNIDADLQLSVAGYRSDGYYLTTANEDLSFSEVEELQLVLSRSVLEDGVDDDPGNATILSNQNLLITYERAAVVSSVQNYVSSDVERVVCANPLSRHLIPHFVRYDLRYVGGSQESVVVPELEQQIRDLFPFDALESSDIQKVVLDRGAISITNPLDIIAVVHYPDRSIFIARSQNALTTGRLAAFIPDRLDVQRGTT